MYPRLVGDVGGTNARFAHIGRAGAGLQGVVGYGCAEHGSLLAVMQRYVDEQMDERPRWCALGIATAVLGDRVAMTNHHWSFSIHDMQRELGLERFVVINDFTALAMSLPTLAPDELRQVGPGAPKRHAPVGLIGPGTGLGVSGLMRSATHQTIPIAGEGGHTTLAAFDDEEEALIAILRRRYGHASAERALSGPGLVNLYEAACEVHGVAPRVLSAEEVTGRALTGLDPQCVAAQSAFCSFLGNVAGNVALTLGARGGLYIGGGIVPRLGSWFDRSRFRERFESKGRFRDYLNGVPTYVVHAKESPALRGAAHLLEQG
jgi:glucokinase